jgi:hypothetical protein
MKKMRMLAALLSLVLLIPISSRADCPQETTYAYFGLTTYQSIYICEVVAVPGIVQVEIKVLTAPAGKVRFTLPDPPGGVVLSAIWSFPVTGGDLVNGIELDLGCSGGGTVGTLTVLFSSTPLCSPWTTGDAEVEDCNGNLRPVEVLASLVGGGTCLGCFQHCMGLQPSNLFPPDAATDVPTNTTLTWEGGVLGDDYSNCWIRIGTTPDCSDAQLIAVPCTEDHNIVLDFLQPATTYYWQASWQYIADGCSRGTNGISAVQSFTTEDPLAAEPTTWGRVKSIYRD